MAYTSLGFLLSQSTKTSESSSFFAVEANANVGDFCVLVVASNNITTTDGNTNDHLTVTDSGGNTWVKAHEFTNGQGAAAAGATVSIWYSDIQFLLDSGVGAGITVTFPSNVSAKAVTGWRFARASGTHHVIRGVVDVLANDGADAGVITLSGLGNAEHLYIRAGAVEDPLTTYTASTNFTPFNHSGANTTGGGGATNMAARGEFRIVTNTTDTTDPTTAAADQASIMLALNEQGNRAAQFVAAIFVPALLGIIDDGGGQYLSRGLEPEAVAEERVVQNVRADLPIEEIRLFGSGIYRDAGRDDVPETRSFPGQTVEADDLPVFEGLGLLLLGQAHEPVLDRLAPPAFFIDADVPPPRDGEGVYLRGERLSPVLDRLPPPASILEADSPQAEEGFGVYYSFACLRFQQIEEPLVPFPVQARVSLVPDEPQREEGSGLYSGPPVSSFIPAADEPRMFRGPDAEPDDPPPEEGHSVLYGLPQELRPPVAEEPRVPARAEAVLPDEPPRLFGSGVYSETGRDDVPAPPSGDRPGFAPVFVEALQDELAEEAIILVQGQGGPPESEKLSRAILVPADDPPVFDGEGRYVGRFTETPLDRTPPGILLVEADEPPASEGTTGLIGRAIETPTDRLPPRLEAIGPEDPIPEPGEGLYGLPAAREGAAAPEERVPARTEAPPIDPEPEEGLGTILTGSARFSEPRAISAFLQVQADGPEDVDGQGVYLPRTLEAAEEKFDVRVLIPAQVFEDLAPEDGSGVYIGGRVLEAEPVPRRSEAPADEPPVSEGEGIYSGRFLLFEFDRSPARIIVLHPEDPLPVEGFAIYGDMGRRLFVPAPPGMLWPPGAALSAGCGSGAELSPASPSGFAPSA